MKNCIKVFLLILLICQKSLYSESLFQINKRIKQTEKQNIFVSEKIKVSSRDIKRTKESLIKTADRLNILEIKQEEIKDTLLKIETRKIQLLQELVKNRDSLSETISNLIFISSIPTFNSENIHDNIITSSIFSGLSEKFNDQINISIKKINELEQLKKEQEEENQKLKKIAKKYIVKKEELDYLLQKRYVQNEQLKNQQLEIQEKLKILSKQAKNISELSKGAGSSKMRTDSKFSEVKLNSPVRGKVSVEFAEKTSLGLISDGWHIKSKAKALILAPFDGIIKFADNFRGFGKVAIISHTNGYNTVLTNFEDLDVIVGQEVLTGEPIGKVSSSKPEIYFEVRRGDKPINPSLFFNKPS